MQVTMTVSLTACAGLPQRPIVGEASSICSVAPVPDRVEYELADGIRIRFAGLEGEFIPLLEPESGFGFEIEESSQDDVAASCDSLELQRGFATSRFPARAGVLSTAWSSVWEAREEGWFVVPPGWYRVVIRYLPEEDRARGCVCRSRSFRVLQETELVELEGGAAQGREREERLP